MTGEAVPAEVCEDVYADTREGRPTGWPVFYDRDGEPWSHTTHAHDGDTVMLPFAGDMRPMLRRDVLAEFGPLVTTEQYDEYLSAKNARMAREHAEREGNST